MKQERSNISRGLFGAGFVLFLLGILVMVGLAAWLVLAVSWHKPIMIPVVAGAVLAFVFMLRRQARTERAEIERFQWRRPTADETFLEQAGIDKKSPEAEVALTARRVFAELGGITPQSVMGGDRFYPDFERLPFYDSVDGLEILFTLEKELSIKILRPQSDQLLALVLERPSCTVADAVREVIRIWRTAPRLLRA